ncbi:helix-turn-helix domain-containing protein [Streptomyces sp. MK37H]|uniref:helix-turn-helix domain-containing protein n=1 Tax=Streptomyces sp. MK37H TaxID=2699117 RepID=UPI0027E552F6|nr:helix-turn-helix domain-containing protein [Streptomyces sp. MK37H]
MFRSEDVPVADRFDYWRELMVQTVVPMDISSDDDADGFEASIHVLELGAVQVRPTTFQSVHFHRTPKLIRRSDPELLHVLCVERGTVGVSQLEQQTTHGPGDLSMVDFSRPFDSHAVNDRGPVKAVGVAVPKEMLALAGNGANELLGHRISAREGFGALLAQCISHITTETGSLQPSDGPRLGTIVLDLVSALIAHELHADNALTPESRWRTLTLHIHSFIQQHLADPQLTPRAIAAAHHISLSHLHRLFREEGTTTVAALIRHQRLERARRDLTDPTLRHTTIHQIATRWGFTRAADFTRAFRAHYGMPPRDYRHRALGIQCETHC